MSAWHVQMLYSHLSNLPRLRLEASIGRIVQKCWHRLARSPIRQCAQCADERDIRGEPAATVALVKLFAKYKAAPEELLEELLDTPRMRGHLSAIGMKL